MRTLTAIPIYNEERHVCAVVSRVLRLTNDLLLIDDGSTDCTVKAVEKIRGISVIRHPTNQGYGQSLIDAFHYAIGQGYDWVVTLDCDEQHEPARIPAFIERAEQGDVDIISGSRYLLPHDDSAPEDRRRINMQITKLLNCRLGLNLTDAFCGFKAYRMEAIARLRLTEPGYAFPLQFWVQAVHHGLRITELPVRLIYNDPNRSFGGVLDDPEARLRHYLAVFDAEMARVSGGDVESDAACGAGCSRDE